MIIQLLFNTILMLVQLNEPFVKAIDAEYDYSISHPKDWSCKSMKHGGFLIKGPESKIFTPEVLVEVWPKTKKLTKICEEYVQEQKEMNINRDYVVNFIEHKDIDDQRAIRYSVNSIWLERNLSLNLVFVSYKRHIIFIWQGWATLESDLYEEQNEKILSSLKFGIK